MRRALLAGIGLGVLAGLAFVFHDAVLRLSVAWPIILGFALWEATGRRGTRGVMAALAAAIGAVAGYATFAAVAEWMPITDLSLGIAVGVAVGVLVIAGLWARERLPLTGLLVGYAAFAGLFFPRWEQSAATVRSHGIEDLTVTLLGLVLGVLVASVFRAVTDRTVEAEGPDRQARAVPAADAAVKGGAS